MAKSKKIQERSKQIQHLPPSHTYTTHPVENDEEDDICPVCESECTCEKAPLRTTPTNNKFNVTSSTAPPSFPTLKIKLTLPPRVPVAGTSSTTSGDDVDGEHAYSVPSGSSLPPPLPFVTPLPKKRGRPSKAAIQAREAAARAAAEAVALNKEIVTGRPQRQRQSTAIANKKGGSLTKRGPGRPPKKSKQIPLPQSSSDSDSELSDASGEFPTFVSASAISDSGSSDSSSSSSLSSIDDDDDADSAIEAEEEELIVKEESEAQAKARVKRELLGEIVTDKKGHRWDQMHWGKRSKRKSSGGPSGSVSAGEVDADADSDSDGQDDETEEDGENEDDDDADVPGEGLERWSESDEDYDAEFFFANLSESSFNGGASSDEEFFYAPTTSKAASGSHDGIKKEEDDDSHTSELDTVSLAEAAEAGIPFPYSINRRRKGKGTRRKKPQLPLVVMEDWDGKLVFANGLQDGEPAMVLDLELKDSEQENIEMGVDDTEDGDDEADLEDMDYDMESSVDGNTTADDEDIDLSMGLPPPPPPPSTPFLRFPTPPAPSVNPLSTFTPVASPGNPLLPPFTPASADPPTSPLTGTKPADILANQDALLRTKIPTMPAASELKRSDTKNTKDSPSAANGELRPRAQPLMGAFEPLISLSPRARAFVVDGSKSSLIPSPFEYLKRRRAELRGRKREASETSDLCTSPSKRLRAASLSGSQATSSRSPASQRHRRSFSDDVDSPGGSFSEQYPMSTVPESIELHDVLDFNSFLDDEESGGDMTIDGPESKRLLKNLSRWDRIPVGTFRRFQVDAFRIIGPGSPKASARASGGVGSVLGPPLRLSDGFSYGSTSSTSRTPYASASTTLWDPTSSPVQSVENGRERTRGRPRARSTRSRTLSVVISPVIFPVEDGKTPPPHDTVDKLSSLNKSQDSESSSNAIPPLSLDQ